MRPLLLLASLFALTAGSAGAQVPRRTAPAPVPQTTGLPAQSGAAPAAAVPAYPKGYTDKHLGGTTSPTFPNGLPERNLDNGTSRADQPRANQAQPGARPTRSILRKRR
ncbi:hypothetical protein [Hymenobacter properus]|uniref:Translation initiation factor IF-2 n=1 Tax=Hymenobacter properus TaxID=2791026 RepID=A0A931FH90_9BACT|nr:hypothetical protein [Hymenobacter properus]MBF9140802.1 hypothetical protein [Hymenobacter properus]MBR7719611.1 hypothetical protein [Microvirga sp. SRT04]